MCFKSELLSLFILITLRKSILFLSRGTIDVAMYGSPIRWVDTVRHLRFQLHRIGRGNRLRVSATAPVAKFYVAANTIMPIPGCQNLLLRMRIIQAYARPHIDRTLQLYNFVCTVDKHFLGFATRKVTRRAFGFHPGCAEAIVAVFSKTPISDARAGQMCVFRPSQILRVSGTAAAVIGLRKSGVDAHAAAFIVSAELISLDHSCRAYNIRALLTCPDHFSV